MMLSTNLVSSLNKTISSSCRSSMRCYRSVNKPECISIIASNRLVSTNVTRNGLSNDRLQHNPKLISKFCVKTIHTSKLLRLPPHKIVPMPSLSPTMESGSIAKWIITEGGKFEPGQAICEVETDKATVTYDATDEGYIAKIFVGTGEVKVGQPLMVTVDEESDVSAFKDFTVGAAATEAAPVAVSTPTPVPSTPSVSAPVSPVSVSSSTRVFASPLAKKLAKDQSLDITSFQGSGPNSRIIAADILNKNLKPSAIVSAPVSTSQSTASTSPVVTIDSSLLPGNIYQDFTTSVPHREVAARLTIAKQIVPHYYLSVDLNLNNLLKLREDLLLKSKVDVSLLDLLVKATALAIKQVPDVNGSWFETYIRRYEQVDINVVVGSGDGLVTPVIRDVASKGLLAISNELSSIEKIFLESSGSTESNSDLLAVGTFTVHNLGIYGIKSAAPIVLPPQACAIAFGTVVDTVIPRSTASKSDENIWEIAPVMTTTLSCDHRVIDGAVGAQFLQAFKSIVENPLALLL